MIDPAQTDSIIKNYIGENDWRVRENANTSKSFSGMRSFLSSTALAHHSLSLLPEPIRKAHKEGAIHIHDLDGSLMTPYCYGADLQNLLINGLRNPVGARSRPAKHLDTAIDHITNFIYISQTEFNGAQAFANFDTLLAPYAEDVCDANLKQQMQRLIYNMSFPLRSAFQTPFFNLSFDINVPDHLANEPIVKNGHVSEIITYGDMQDQVNRVNKAFLQVMLEGDSLGRPFSFPIPTYSITHSSLSNAPIMNMIYQLSSKFGIPNFQNYIGSDNDPSDVRSMCCRMSLDLKDLKSRGLWNMGQNTGSIGVSTINLLDAAKKGSDNFVERIETAMDMSKECLLIKHKMVNESYQHGLMPFTRMYLPEKDPFRTFFLTIGTHAMDEACLHMFEEPIEENIEYVCETLLHMRSYLNDIIDETDLLFNLEETPCEGATTRLAKLARSQGLPVKGKEIPFLTNSTHVAVTSDMDMAACIGVQEQFKPLYTGGTAFHGYVGERLPVSTTAHIIEAIAETKIPYYNVSPVYSVCDVHGDTSGYHETCSICGAPNKIYSRIVGYIRPLDAWNAGKQSEFHERRDLLTSRRIGK